jgi:hypothetical protein
MSSSTDFRQKKLASALPMGACADGGGGGVGAAADSVAGVGGGGGARPDGGGGAAAGVCAGTGVVRVAAIRFGMMSGEDMMRASTVQVRGLARLRGGGGGGGCARVALTARTRLLSFLPRRCARASCTRSARARRRRLAAWTCGWACRPRATSAARARAGCKSAPATLATSSSSCPSSTSASCGRRWTSCSAFARRARACCWGRTSAARLSAPCGFVAPA